MRLALAAVAATALALPASAEQVMYMAELMPGDAVSSSGHGLVGVMIDTDAMTMEWIMGAADLSGEPLAAHFHGPAPVGEDAPPVIDMTVDEGMETEGEAVPADIMMGMASISPDDWTEIQNGFFYVNVHTQQYPDGEIRGQLLPGTADPAMLESLMQ